MLGLNTYDLRIRMVTSVSARALCPGFALPTSRYRLQP